MGFFSSDSKSSTTTINKTANFNNLDYGQDGGGSFGLGKNLNLAESSLEVGDVISTDHGAVTSAIDLAGRVNQTNSDNLLELGDRAYDDVEDSREMATTLFGTGIDSVNSANRDALQFLGQRTDRALAFAQKATRSEGTQTIETLTKYFMIGAAGIAGLILFTKGRN